MMRLSKGLLWSAAAALAFFSASMAKADIYTFAISPKGGQTFSFTLDSSPTPGEYLEGQFSGFGVFGVTTTIRPQPFYEIYFYGPGAGNGLSIFDGDANSYVPFFEASSARPLYQGPESSPTFLTGSYSLSNDFGDSVGSLTISAPVPELSTWAMMIFGFASLTLIAYRKSGRGALAAA